MRAGWIPGGGTDQGAARQVQREEVEASNDAGTPMSGRDVRAAVNEQGARTLAHGRPYQRAGAPARATSLALPG